MGRISKIQVCRGVWWVEVPQADLRILCGCPADSVKHLMKKGLILERESDGVVYESGPNAILLSDVGIQNGNFANMGEFPVLQMLYRQGMILPNHPGNTGEAPLLIGSREQIEAQMRYIYRGNYGLISPEEMVEAGASPERAQELMRIKLRFAFGRIRPSDEFLESRVAGEGPVDVRNGVSIVREGLNRFRVEYEGESLAVDLNLPERTDYPSPYKLGFYDIRREYFAVIHSGQGDGWDIYRPTMSSILMFQGKIYLVDAGPNLITILTALGIGLNEVEGIFHTHAHDDHFAGLTTLLASDHKIKYYATPLVRASVAKKLCALLSMDESGFEEFFEIHDLEEERWNMVEGLEVQPLMSPHPVETTILLFRTMWGGSYKTYAHFADIVSLKVLEGMVTDDPSAPGTSPEIYRETLRHYMQAADLKKLDIGGGLIHGEAEDFAGDNSGKILLAHTAKELTIRQREIGSSAPFGMVDVLIPAIQNYQWKFAARYLRAAFPGAEKHQLDILLNNPVPTFNPETIFLKGNQPVTHLYLLITGTVEAIAVGSGAVSTLSAGAFIGEIGATLGHPSPYTFRAVSFVQALEVPVRLYLQFLEQSAMKEAAAGLIRDRERFRVSRLLGKEISHPVQHKLIREAKIDRYPAGHAFTKLNDGKIRVILEGAVTRFHEGTALERLGRGEWFGEEKPVFRAPCPFRFRTEEETLVAAIPGRLLRAIPYIRWKLLENYEKIRKSLPEAENAEP